MKKHNIYLIAGISVVAFMTGFGYCCLGEKVAEPKPGEVYGPGFVITSFFITAVPLFLGYRAGRKDDKNES